jgi:hypothetical protein
MDVHPLKMVINRYWSMSYVMTASTPFWFDGLRFFPFRFFSVAKSLGPRTSSITPSNSSLEFTSPTDQTELGNYWVNENQDCRGLQWLQFLYQRAETTAVLPVVLLRIRPRLACRVQWLFEKDSPACAERWNVYTPHVIWGWVKTLVPSEPQNSW